MNVEDFNFLANHLTQHIGKKDSRLRESISVGERLAVTLRYLATGDSFGSLMSVFLLGKTTICNIIRETCEAIFRTLNDDFLKMRFMCNQCHTYMHNIDEVLRNMNLTIEKNSQNIQECNDDFQESQKMQVKELKLLLQSIEKKFGERIDAMQKYKKPVRRVFSK
ncbi:uncharacterized protein LOC118740295 [Rhagoletis pomonella]|uniref:uncharacterized protein LOC118740295 n=1 Tax=Rhagoletis pomonella TaxID=28610 RepID=UPI00177F29E7|nr:uncharacterized protein LOC118740295 [Rhagoletis pomonella]